jgi:hypothetical protein
VHDRFLPAEHVLIVRLLEPSCAHQCIHRGRPNLDRFRHCRTEASFTDAHSSGFSSLAASSSVAISMNRTRPPL